MHWRQIDARLALDVTLLLVAVSFKTSLSDQTPPVAYLTFLDTYNLMSVAFLMLGTLLHALIGFMTRDCDAISGDCEFHFEESQYSWMGSAYTMDNICLTAYGCLLLMSNALWCTCAWTTLLHNPRERLQSRLDRLHTKLQHGRLVPIGQGVVPLLAKQEGIERCR